MKKPAKKMPKLDAEDTKGLKKMGTKAFVKHEQSDIKAAKKGKK